MPAKAKKGENVKVVVRCRPLNSTEKNAGMDSIVTMFSDMGQVKIVKPDEPDAPPKTFTFDHVYGPETKQLAIFDETAKPLVDDVIEGYNGTIFAYGQTGTGKTFTMEGVPDDPDLRGVMPNAFHYIFDAIKDAAENTQYLVRMSFLEIYMEDVFDLLNRSERRKMEVKESKDKGVFVKDLSMFNVKTPSDCMRILHVGQKQRKVGATKMNAGSSRSHSILTITVETSETDQDGNTKYRVGKLNLVDLAGSERQKKTEATGDRLQEAKSINLSLSALGNVIKALINPKATHVPFRDSKLTRLLQDSLGGNTKTVMCANLGPAAHNYDETMSTLRYANRAKSIKNKPRINEDPKDAMLREMTNEIAKLKAMLEARKKGLTGMEAALAAGMVGGPTEGYDGPDVETRVVTKHVERQLPFTEEDLKNAEAKAKAEIEAVEAQTEEEKKKLEQDKEKAAEAARIYAEEVKAKQEALEAERLQLEKMKQMIEAKEQQVLSGAADVDAVSEKKNQLLKAEELAREQEEKENALRQQLIESEETALFLNEQYTNTQEELQSKTKKLKQLYLKYREKRDEVQDLQDEFEIEKEELIDTIRELDRQIKLKSLVLDQFVPPEITQLIEENGRWDSFNDQWLVPGLEYAHSNVRRRENEMDQYQDRHAEYAHHGQGFGGNFDPMNNNAGFQKPVEHNPFFTYGIDLETLNKKPKRKRR